RIRTRVERAEGGAGVATRAPAARSIAAASASLVGHARAPASRATTTVARSGPLIRLHMYRMRAAAGFDVDPSDSSAEARERARRKRGRRDSFVAGPHGRSPHRKRIRWGAALTRAPAPGSCDLPPSELDSEVPVPVRDPLVQVDLAHSPLA